MMDSAKSGQAVGSGSALTTKNPRKRSQASRRAPTTVLTTDITNFRPMVENFTGINPAPPFSGHLDKTILSPFSSSPNIGNIDNTNNNPMTTTAAAAGAFNWNNPTKFPLSGDTDYLIINFQPPMGNFGNQENLVGYSLNLAEISMEENCFFWG